MKELDSVVLAVNLPEHGLERGDVGTIVHIHGEGEAFIVEFITYGGDTVAVVTLNRSQLRAAKNGELPHARALAG